MASDRDLRQMQRDRQAVERERDSLLQELRAVRQEIEAQSATEAAGLLHIAGAERPSGTGTQPVPDTSVRDAPRTGMTPSPTHITAARHPLGSKTDPMLDISITETQPIIDMANPLTTGEQLQSPSRGAPVRMSPAHTVSGVNLTGSKTDPMLNISPKEVNTIGDMTSPSHTHGAAAVLQPNIGHAHGANTYFSDETARKDGPDRDDSLGLMSRDDPVPVHQTGTSTPLETGTYNPDLDYLSSENEDLTDPDGLKVEAVGTVNEYIDIADTEEVQEEEKRTMKMLNDLLAQTKALSLSHRREPEKISRTDYRTVDEDLDEKIAMERIPTLKHEERIMNDRKLQKEKEMAEAEKRLMQLKEKECRFEEALREKERKEMEERKRQERLLFIKEEERKLIETLKQKYEEERLFDVKLEKMQKEEMQRLEHMQRRQEALNKQMPSQVKLERNEDIRPQMRVIEKRGDTKQIEIESELNRNREIRESRDNNPDRTTISTPIHRQEEREQESLRRNELDRREIYLKQLEADLLKKEEEIRAKLNVASVENSTEKHKIQAVEQSVKSQDGSGSVNSEPSCSLKPELTHFIKPNISQFSGVDPTPKNESKFEAWKLEIETLRRSNMFPDYLVGQYIRNSLKVPARNTLLTIGPMASSQEMIDKLTSVFGNVASGQSIMQEFYTAVQQPEESVTMWSLRLEEILQRVSEKSQISADQKNEMLRERFWRSLHNTELQNATQVYYHQTKSFEELRSKVRAEEYERFTHKKALEEVNTVQQGRTTQSKRETQHQPLTFTPDKQNREQELMKRLDIVEKMLRSNRNYQNRQRQRYRRNQNQNQTENQSPNQNQNRQQQQQQQQGQQTQTDKTTDQKEDKRLQGQNTNAKKTEQDKKRLN